MDIGGMPEPSESKLIARARAERRRFHRVKLSIAGRLFLPATKEETACVVEYISPGDALLLCKLAQEPRGTAILYIDKYGRFEGPVMRFEPRGFAMEFRCSQQKRDRLADQLMLEINRDILKEADLRRYDRVEAASGSYTCFTRASGEQVRCEVLDLSLTGVSVRTEIRPAIGEHILIGNRAGRVARHHTDGIGIEFLGVAQPSVSLLDRPFTPAAPGPMPLPGQPMAVSSQYR
jgi:hypothetical protein